MNRKDFQKREENEQILGIPEAANSEEDDNSERHHDTDRTDQTGQEMFDGLIEKLDSNYDKSMTAQLGRFRASTTAFQKIANGYTQKKYIQRHNFLEFLERDILSSDAEANNEDDF